MHPKENSETCAVRECRGRADGGVSFWKVILCVIQIGKTGKENKNIVESRIMRQKPKKFILT